MTSIAPNYAHGGRLNIEEHQRCVEKFLKKGKRTWRFSILESGFGEFRVQGSGKTSLS